MKLFVTVVALLLNLIKRCVSDGAWRVDYGAIIKRSFIPVDELCRGCFGFLLGDRAVSGVFVGSVKPRRLKISTNALQSRRHNPRKGWLTADCKCTIGCCGEFRVALDAVAHLVRARRDPLSAPKEMSQSWLEPAMTGIL